MNIACTEFPTKAEETKLAFLSMLEHNKRDFYRLAVCYVGSEQNALDMVGEATFKAYASLGRLRDAGYMKTWFTRILINECNAFLRQNKRVIYDEVFIQNSAAESSNTAETVDLYAAVNNLSSNYKNVLY